LASPHRLITVNTAETAEKKAVVARPVNAPIVEFKEAFSDHRHILMGGGGTTGIALCAIFVVVV
jgi:hypothetical protein